MKGTWRNAPLRNTQIGKSSVFIRTSSWNAKSLTFLASQPQRVTMQGRMRGTRRVVGLLEECSTTDLKMEVGEPLFFFFFLLFIGIKLLYSVVLVSAVQQSESAICPLFFRFPSQSGYHRALSRVP